MIKVPVGRGFLPSYDPLRKLPSDFAQLEEVASNLPKHYTEGTIRNAVLSLPILSVDNLSGSEQEAVMRDYAFIVSAYYHTPKHQPPSHIPSNLAVPFYQISKRFGKPSILSYCSYCLNNWWKRFHDNGVGIELGNIEIIRKFTFERDEEWFILIHVDIEANAAPLLPALVAAVEASKFFDNLALEQNLILIGKIVNKLYKTLCRMNEECHPEAYFQKVRPPIMFFKQVIFEGVEELEGKPIDLLGETGAQSSIIPSLDAALGVFHEQGKGTDFLAAHQGYMPPDHRQFIADLKRESTIKDRVFKVGGSLRIAYDFVLLEMERFRSQHLKWAKQYIFDHLPNKIGTGGTPADVWLAKLRDETR